MKNKNPTAIKEEHLARAKAHNLSISTKHAIEICRHLRYKNTNLAKEILEETIKIKRAIPFLKFKRDVGHKPGMAAGRYPKKAAQEILKLIKAVEANAQFKGLNTSNLKIIHFLANKAAIPFTGGRHRTGTKRTDLEIAVTETKEKKKKEQKPAAKTAPQKEKAVKVVQKENKKVEEKVAEPQPEETSPATQPSKKKEEPQEKESKTPAGEQSK